MNLGFTTLSMVLLMDGENNIMEETAVMEDSYDDGFSCGDPRVEPRVGDEFQVEIPPMMSASKRAVFLSTPVALDDSSYSFLVGLPVQIMWIDKQRRGQGNGDDNVDMNQSLKSLRAKKSRSSAKNRGKSDKNLESKKQRLDLEAVPAIPSSSWEEFEVASFVLGLYTFGKNFTQVKNFMENKGVGEIMLFYYGKFYNSAKYHSWSESRKKRNRKCVYGRKLYSGWRQQQLLTRLMPSIPDESQKQMLVNAFAQGNVTITLEKYVNTVKTLVGLRLLVDAVAIGKEKEDLTVPTSTPMKTKPWFTVSSKPSSVQGLGAYNSLTSAGIINQLTGCSRMSKARCNDIFWYAIWPRLLGRGWHSEQPEDRGYLRSKDYIVFMVPGVKKFSRQELIKGDHYYDSISDILTKVVSEPELIDLETGGEIREATADEFFVAENSSDQSDEEFSRSDSQRHRYLRSPCSNRGTLGMKFTVVDTSLAAGGGKLCDLRNPNAVLSLVSEPKTRPGEKESSAPKNSLDSQNVEKSQVRPRDINNQVDDQMRFTIIDTSVDYCEKLSGFRRWRPLPSDVTKRGYVGDDSAIKEEKTFEKIKDPSKSLTTHRRTPRAETNYHLVNSAPVMKRRRLSACISRESPVFKHLSGDNIKRTGCLESDQQDICGVQHQNSTCEEMNWDKEAYETVLSVEHTNLKSDQPIKTGTGPSSLLVEIQETSEIEPSGLNSISNADKHCSPEKIRTSQKLVLSEPEPLCSVSESEKKGASIDMEQKQAVELPSISGSNANRCSSNDPETTQELGSSEQQHDQQNNTDGPRRQSTRKRPLTTRALEALESGFLTNKSIKSTSKLEPRKRESSTKKKRSAKACNRNGSADLEHKGDDRSIFVKKAPTSKPLDQIEDSKPSYLLNEARAEGKAVDGIQDPRPVQTQYPKLPPIVLKFPFRRG
ncbi:uncharacterized protein LOC17896690 isoform X2 [Capsella rubella]|uniref:uncharacterized protein LOC17896690 isoform X2 n=1 Tax=Capsella rubella TaxID=81985 RepID=UPI000CD58818|nr:uncharacterized protein LOC17896690 isoform X2 [Capsella rubella]